MPLVLFMDPMSQPSRAVHQLLLEAGVPFELRLTHIARGETRTKEFARVNPNRTVPALEDAGFTMFESHAMMRYICHKYNVADQWYPKDPVERAKVDTYLDWHHAHLRRGSSQVVFSCAFAPAMGRMDAAQIAHVSREGAGILRAALARIEQSYLPTEQFLMGRAAPSIADLSAAQELYMTVHLTGQPDLTAYPRVAAWLARVEAATPKSWPVVTAPLQKALQAGKMRAAAAPLAAKAFAPTIQTNATAASVPPAASSSSGLSARAAAGSGSGNLSLSPQASTTQAGPIFAAIGAQLAGPDGAEAVSKLGAIFRFVVKPEQGQPVTFELDLKNAPGGVRELTPANVSQAPKPDCTFTLSDAAFVGMATGATNPQVAFLSGKLKLAGNLAKAMSFNTHVFGKASIKAKIIETVKSLPPTKPQSKL